MKRRCERYHVVVPELTIVLVRGFLFPEESDHEEDNHEGDHVPDGDVAGHVMGPVTRVASSPFNNSILNINSCSRISKGTLSLNSSDDLLPFSWVNFEIRFHDIPVNIVLTRRSCHGPNIVEKAGCRCLFK